MDTKLARQTKGGTILHFFSREGPRPHIHVVRGGGTMKVWLDTLTVAREDGLTASERRRILELISEHRFELLRAWNDHFDQE